MLKPPKENVTSQTTHTSTTSRHHNCPSSGWNRAVKMHQRRRIISLHAALAPLPSHHRRCHQQRTIVIASTSSLASSPSHHLHHCTVDAIAPSPSIAALTPSPSYHLPLHCRAHTIAIAPSPLPPATHHRHHRTNTALRPALPSRLSPPRTLPATVCFSQH